jgi:uncharacterized protein
VIIVSDTTALTTLMKACLESVLERLFESVVIPEMVALELTHFHSEIPAWCIIRRIHDHPLLPEVSSRIDPGEAEAICLALELSADAILLDDRKGRREAEAHGLHCLALPAILLEAKRRDFIPSLRVALDQIDQFGNYRLKAQTRDMLLREVGEIEG